ncbi:DeoR/GlpR transcriptional regulator [Actinobacteria bacterium YIM 96077]|uniref:Lactose phosphotransferase system repressor n=1 Tax=Phytoactinopolyspora halophila TaxID=1981511 RepID=A0A329QEM2_9ACTN|nr:DeoR/GlpR family DNA-binding transcription regulator [Phytoactinopolyspora halophila]AYY13600.1 DeoR/GlpR transcriptional regulator [Actinobacteria bacterium YIM 96077]RAW10734.1 DeoR/GlpR transcriptional regulator [Phytoactinopolyspora halophila]
MSSGRPPGAHRHGARRHGAERRAEIMRLLHVNGFQSVTQLTELLNVSDMTVRRDLKRLSDAGELRIVHGGASLLHATLRTADFTSRGAQESEAKRRIARRAVSLVDPDATVAIDAGTTTFELAAALPDHFHGCVISHSVPVLQHMLNVPRAQVIGLGGELLPTSQAFIGPLTIEALSGVRADTLFLGAAAVGERDLFVSTDHERPTKQALIACVKRVVLLADHTKFGAAAPVRLGPLEDVDTLVCDRPLEPELASAFAAAGVSVLIAE